jgi:hypothetical protein
MNPKILLIALCGLLALIGLVQMGNESNAIASQDTQTIDTPTTTPTEPAGSTPATLPAPPAFDVGQIITNQAATNCGCSGGQCSVNRARTVERKSTATATREQSATFSGRERGQRLGRAAAAPLRTVGRALLFRRR